MTSVAQAEYRSDAQASLPAGVLRWANSRLRITSRSNSHHWTVLKDNRDDARKMIDENFSNYWQANGYLCRYIRVNQKKRIAIRHGFFYKRLVEFIGDDHQMAFYTGKPGDAADGHPKHHG